MARLFTGPEKAAILLMSLGEENAIPILENMDEREIQMIGNYIYGLGDDLVNAFVKLKMQEWDSYSKHLSSWERKNTLDC